MYSKRDVCFAVLALAASWYLGSSGVPMHVGNADRGRALADGIQTTSRLSLPSAAELQADGGHPPPPPPTLERAAELQADGGHPPPPLPTLERAAELQADGGHPPPPPWFLNFPQIS
jgi:hypothetical protein